MNICDQDVSMDSKVCKMLGFHTRLTLGLFIIQQP